MFKRFVFLNVFTNTNKYSIAKRKIYILHKQKKKPGGEILEKWEKKICEYVNVEGGRTVNI